MIISLIIFLFVSAIMVGLGISQLKSESPVGFYTGEKPPQKENLINVTEWNKKHGIMWIAYGIIIMLSWLAGFFMGDTIWSVVPLCIGIILPLIIMILYHHKLIRQYKK